MGNSMKEIKLRRKIIGNNYPAYFIADIAANHDGNLERAKYLISLAKESGADAVKFQNFHADRIVSDKGFKKLGSNLSHQKTWGKNVFEVYEEAAIPEDWTKELKFYADSVDIDYFTSPYDFESVDMVDVFVDMYKIGSGDITWTEMIEYIAKKGKPVMIATGASDFSDVKRAMDILYKYTNNIVLMQCNTNYTASPENFRYINLNVLKKYREEFPDVVLGLSDHTPGSTTVLGARVLGASVFEKHFTDNNNRKGPDHKFSMTPSTWIEMVERVREIENALGDGIKKIEENEKETSIVQRRSLRFTKNLSRGHLLTKEDLFPLRPIIEGLEPYRVNELINKKLNRDVFKEEEITWSDIQND